MAVLKAHSSNRLPESSSREADSARSIAPTRKLDFFISVYNRPAYLRDFLRTALAADMPGAHFVVFDDASDGAENVPGLGVVSTEQVY